MTEYIRYVWLLELCQDPDNHPFEMTTLGVFEEVSANHLDGWAETSPNIWVKRTPAGEYFLKRLLIQKSPEWMAIFNPRIAMFNFNSAESDRIC